MNTNYFDRLKRIEQAERNNNSVLLHELLADPTLFDNNEFWNNPDYAELTATKMLEDAVRHNNIEIVKGLLDNPFIQECKRIKKCIMLASYRGHLDIFHELLSHVTIEKNGYISPKYNTTEDSIPLFTNNLLQNAAYNSQISMVFELLKYPGINPLVALKSSRSGELVKALIAHGIDPSSNDNYVILIATKNAHIDVIKELLKDPRINPCLAYNSIRYIPFINSHDYQIKLLYENDLRIALYNNNVVTMHDIVYNPDFVRPPKKSLVYKLGTIHIRQELNQLYYEYAKNRIISRVPLSVSQLIIKFLF
jgi:hypothetical protein